MLNMFNSFKHLLALGTIIVIIFIIVALGFIPSVAAVTDAER